MREKALIDRFIREVASDGLAAYGEKQVREVIASGQAERILLSEELDYVHAEYSCGCGNAAERTAKEKPARVMCEKCGNEMKMSEEKNLLDELIDLAGRHGIEVVLISTGTTEGAQFLQGFTGVGAFLRYRK